MFSRKLLAFNGFDVLIKGTYNFISQKLFAGTNGSTIASLASIAGDNQNVGANIVQEANYFKNGLIEGADLIDGTMGIDATSETGGKTAADANDVTDGTLTTNVTFAGDLIVRYDLGGGNEQAINRIGVVRQGFHYNNSPVLVQVKTSDDDVTYSNLTAYRQQSLLDQMLLVDEWPAGITNDYDFVNSTAKRYWEFTFLCTGRLTGDSPSSNTGLEQLAARITILATTDNTFDAKMPVAVASTFNPSTAIIKDENDSEVGAGVVNVIEVVNGTAGNGGTLVDYLAFKARPQLAPSTNVQIRAQPVGSQKIASVQMGTVATNINIDQSSITQNVAGSDAFKLNADGGIEVLGAKNRVRVNADADDSIVLTDSLYLSGVLTADRNVTLPTAASAYNTTNKTGLKISFVKDGVDTFKLIIDGDGAETISGAATKELVSQWDKITIQSDGSKWVQIA